MELGEYDIGDTVSTLRIKKMILINIELDYDKGPMGILFDIKTNTYCRYSLQAKATNTTMLLTEKVLNVFLR